MNVHLTVAHGMLLGLSCLALACGSPKSSDDGDDKGGVPDKGELSDAMIADTAQTPPLGGSAVAEWLAQGLYKAWACEPKAHEGRSPSPHGANRICSNKLLSEHGTSEYPVGAATVKELFDGTNGSIKAYALALKTKGGGGEAWYWYEGTSAKVEIDGMGSTGKAQSVCVACHQGAGSDAAHSGHDLIYTQVR